MARPNKLRRRADGRYCTMINGKDVYFGTNKARALRDFHTLMADIRPSCSVVSHAPVNLDGLIGRWLIVHPGTNNANRSKPFQARWGTTFVSKVDVDVLRTFLNQLSSAGYKARSIRDFVGTARRILAWGHEHGWIDRIPPLPRLPKAAKMEKDIEPTAAQFALDALPEPAKSLAWFVLLTGARPGEARLLRWKQIDWETGRCILSEHKTAKATGRARILHLSDAARRLLAESKEAASNRRPSEFVFVSRLGKPYTASGFRRILTRRGLVPYHLRHTFAQIGSETLLPQELAALMGHTDVRTTQHYFSVKADRANRVVNSVAVPKPASSRPHKPSRQPAAKRRAADDRHESKSARQAKKRK